jgi:hypothetical protein
VFSTVEDLVDYVSCALLGAHLYGAAKGVPLRVGATDISSCRYEPGDVVNGRVQHSSSMASLLDRLLGSVEYRDVAPLLAAFVGLFEQHDLETDAGRAACLAAANALVGQREQYWLVSVGPQQGLYQVAGEQLELGAAGKDKPVLPSPHQYAAWDGIGAPAQMGAAEPLQPKHLLLVARAGLCHSGVAPGLLSPLGRSSRMASCHPPVTAATWEQGNGVEGSPPLLAPAPVMTVLPLLLLGMQREMRVVSADRGGAVAVAEAKGGFSFAAADSSAKKRPRGGQASNKSGATGIGSDAETATETQPRTVRRVSAARTVKIQVPAEGAAGGVFVPGPESQLTEVEQLKVMERAVGACVLLAEGNQRAVASRQALAAALPLLQQELAEAETEAVKLLWDKFAQEHGVNPEKMRLVFSGTGSQPEVNPHAAAAAGVAVAAVPGGLLSSRGSGAAGIQLPAAGIPGGGGVAAAPIAGKPCRCMLGICECVTILRCCGGGAAWLTQQLVAPVGQLSTAVSGQLVSVVASNGKSLVYGCVFLAPQIQQEATLTLLQRRSELQLSWKLRSKPKVRSKLRVAVEAFGFRR